MIYLYKTCLGINDTPLKDTLFVDHEKGITELSDCVNMTVNSMGHLVNTPAYSTVITHSAPVLGISGSSRLFYKDSVDTYELVGLTTPNKRFTGKLGAVVHTPIDVRISHNSGAYKSNNTTPTEVQATVGTNPDPSTSKVLSAMPSFSAAVVHNANLCILNDKFVQYSRDYKYDLWDIANDFIPQKENGVAIKSDKNAIAVSHAMGVNLYAGGSIRATRKKSFFAVMAANTLWGGQHASIGEGFLFLTANGVYLLNAEGTATLLTETRLRNALTTNTTYYGAEVIGNKYVMYGNNCIYELDLDTKAVTKRASGITGAAVVNDTGYLISGNAIIKDSNSAVASCSVTFPFSNFMQEGRLIFDSLYFTGEIAEGATLTVDLINDPDAPATRWTRTLAGAGKVQGMRIKLPQAATGARGSLKLSCAGGAFSIAEIKVRVGSGRLTQGGF